MSFEANLKAEDDGKRRLSRMKLFALLAILSLNALAFCGFQYLFRVERNNQNSSDLSLQESNKFQSSVVIEKQDELSTQLNDTLEEIRDLRRQLRRSRERMAQMEGKHLKLLLDIQANTRSILEAESDEGRNSAGEEINQLIEADPYHRWMLDRRDTLPQEFREYVATRKLVFGWNPALGTDSMTATVGQACIANLDDITKFMTYEVGKLCPDDDNLAQKLLLHGCEPLPRRRCLARGPEKPTDPLPYPTSLWTQPPDENIHWSAYSCKSFECLNTRAARKVFADCLDCVDLKGREAHRWVGRPSLPGAVDFTVEQVLAMKSGIRVGLDIGGGTGSFAVRMREHNVTIITSTLNLNGPFNNFIAQRGVIPIFASLGQRFPFWDNTLDIVHSMHVLSNWIPFEILEFIFYDIDRVLRPGGVLWLDHFFCIQSELDTKYAPLIRSFGYKELRWDVGRKLDRGAEKKEVYLSALLEKPFNGRNQD